MIFVDLQSSRTCTLYFLGPLAVEIRSASNFEEELRQVRVSTAIDMVGRAAKVLSIWTDYESFLVGMLEFL